MQVWDYNTDGSMTFNLLYTFPEHNGCYNRIQHYKTRNENSIRVFFYGDIKKSLISSYRKDSYMKLLEIEADVRWHLYWYKWSGIITLSLGRRPQR